MRIIAISEIFDVNLQNNVATVRLTSAKGFMGAQFVDQPFERFAIVVPLSIADANLRLTLNYQECGTYNYGDTWVGKGRHTGQDYACHKHLDPVKVASYGKVVYIYAMPRTYDGQCQQTGKPDHGMGTVIEIEHLLTTGEKIFSSYNHLESTINATDNSVSRFNPTVRPRVAKGEVVGKVGASGQQNNDYWNCVTRSKTNQHLHFEIKRNWYGICGTGAMNANGTSKSCSSWGYVPNHPDTYGYRHPDNYLGKSTVIIPYFSRLNQVPSQSNYDVYVISGQPLYGSITVQPTQSTTFTNIGIRGKDASGNPVTFFNNSSITLNSVSPALKGNRTFTCADLNGCDYKLFPYIGSNGNNTEQEVAEGYPLKVCILPNSNSEIIDNDTRGGNSSSDRFEYNTAATDTEDFPGYYLSSKLFIGKTIDDQWAKWRPSKAGKYRVFVHIPNGIPNAAGNATYKVYTRSGATAAYTKPVDHRYDNSDTMGVGDSWFLPPVPRSGTFADITGYVYLSTESLTTGQRVAADAVKFIWVSSTGLPGTVSVTPTSGTWISSPQYVNSRPKCSKNLLYPDLYHKKRVVSRPIHWSRQRP